MEMLMTYTHVGIESTKSHTQVLCSGPSLLNTFLESRLKKFLGFQPNSIHSLFFPEF